MSTGEGGGGGLAYLDVGGGGNIELLWVFSLWCLCSAAQLPPPKQPPPRQKRRKYMYAPLDCVNKSIRKRK